MFLRLRLLELRRQGAMAPAIATALGHKVKVSTVLEQASDVEVAMLSHGDLIALCRHFVTKTGGDPMERETVTDTQLSALKGG